MPDYIQKGRVKLTLSFIKSMPKSKWVKQHHAAFGIDEESLNQIWEDVNATDKHEESTNKDSNRDTSSNSSGSKKARKGNSRAKQRPTPKG